MNVHARANPHECTLRWSPSVHAPLNTGVVFSLQAQKARNGCDAAASLIELLSNKKTYTKEEWELTSPAFNELGSQMLFRAAKGWSGRYVDVDTATPVTAQQLDPTTACQAHAGSIAASIAASIAGSPHPKAG